MLPLLLCADLDLDSVASSSSPLSSSSSSFAPAADRRARCAYSEYLTRSLASLEGDDHYHNASAADASANDPHAVAADSAFAMRRADGTVTLSALSPSSSSALNRRSLHALLLDRLFVARCIPELCARLVVDALVRVDLSRHAFAVSSSLSSPSAQSSSSSSSSHSSPPTVTAAISLSPPPALRMPLTDALLARLSTHWRDAAFVAHASIAHHRHVAVSLLHALRRVCAATDEVDAAMAWMTSVALMPGAGAGAGADATTAAAGIAASNMGSQLPRTPAQLADWASARAATADDSKAKNQKKTKRGGDNDEDAIDDADLALDPESAPALSLSASYQRLLSSGVVGDMLEGVTLRLNSPLPAYRKLGMQVRVC